MRKKLVTLFLAFSLTISNCTFSEGLLPGLEEVYGIEVPSFTDIVKKNPYSIEITEHGTIYTYKDITDQQYYAYGDALKSAGCKVEGYSVRDNKIEVIISLRGKSFSFVYDGVDATMTVTFPEGVYDAATKKVESQYQQARQALETGKYTEAIEILHKIPDYEKAISMLAEAHYKRGMEKCNRGDFKDALSDLNQALGYPGIQEAIATVYNMMYADAVSNLKFEEAVSIMHDANGKNVAVDNFICYKPGNSGKNVQDFLSIVQTLGYIKKTDSIYKEEYTSAIMSLETRLGLTSDGIIYSDELISIGTTIYPGYHDNRVAKLFEHLVDAGYLKGPLPDEHATYTQRYVSAINKAKKAYGMNGDKLISNDEYETFLNLPAMKVDPVTNIKVKPFKNTTYGVLSISWDASPNAIFYDVYQDDQLLASKVTGTRWRGYANSGVCQYSVVAYNYENQSTKAFSETTEVGLIWITMKELLEHTEKYIGRKILLGNEPKITKPIIEDDTLYFLITESPTASICGQINKYKTKGFYIKNSILCATNSYTEHRIFSGQFLFGSFTGRKRWVDDYGELYVIDLEDGFLNGDGWSAGIKGTK